MSAAQNPASVCKQAQGLLEQGRYDEAQALLLPLTQGANASAQAHELLAMLAVTRDQAQPALHHALAASALLPDHPSVWFTLGRAHKLAGQLPAAIAGYRQALALQPGFAPAWVSLGIALRQNGELDPAIECYEKAIALAPQLGVAHGNLANALVQRAQRDAAANPAAAVTDEVLAASQRAVDLVPDDAQVLYNHGLLLYRAGYLPPAAEFFNRSLALNSTDVQCCLDLGQALCELNRSREAISAYEKWLQLNTPHESVLMELGEQLVAVGRIQQAIAVAEQLVQLSPEGAGLVLLGNALLQARRHEEARAIGDRLKELESPGFLLGLNYFLEDPPEIFAAHEQLRQSLLRQLREQQVQLPPLPVVAQRPTRLRIGLVSGDFAEHSVASFLLPLLQNIDRKRYVLTLYSNRATHDPVTLAIKELGHDWLDCLQLNDKQLLDRVRADQVQVLVDMAGHTLNSRVALFSLRAAAVQMAYLGYSTVSGAPAMDWRLTDACIDSGDLPDFAGEQPLILERSMFCYQPNTSPDIAAAPQLASGVVTFGSFNNVAKLSDATLRLWARVLNAVPNSRLLLKARALGEAVTRTNIFDFLQGQGVAKDRIDLRSRINGKADHLSLYNDVDVALDCYPYNGATTTCEALWMGVPVVSLRGRTHTSRMGHSILSAAGKPEWVTRDPDSFVVTAVALANDLALRAAWREQARSLLKASELFDAVGMARSFETAVDQAWAVASAQR